MALKGVLPYLRNQLNSMPPDASPLSAIDEYYGLDNELWSGFRVTSRKSNITSPSLLCETGSDIEPGPEEHYRGAIPSVQVLQHFKPKSYDEVERWAEYQARTSYSMSRDLEPQAVAKQSVCVCCREPIGKDYLTQGHKWVTDWEELHNAALLGCLQCALAIDAIETYNHHKNLAIADTGIQCDAGPYSKQFRVTLDPGRDTLAAKVRHQKIELDVFRINDFHGEPRNKYRRTAWQYDEYDEYVASLDCNAEDTEPDTIPNTPLNEREWDIRVRRRHSGDTSSPQTINTIREWLNECSQRHKGCGKLKESYPPKRILRLSKTKITLCEGIFKQIPYACLSHCWGETGPDVRLTRDTESQLKTGLALKLLPKTFRDAAGICLLLGIDHIWIDALCIRQDDEDDWRDQAGKMASTYEHAYFTIAATKSKNSSGGCFTQLPQHRHALPLKSPSLFVREKLKPFPFISRDIEAAKDDWPLLTRSWVYQERRLSARMIHFGSEQVFWECKTCLKSECGELNEEYTDTDQYRNLTITALPFGFQGSDLALAWQKTIVEYSGLELTYESDRLPAIAALAQLMMRQRKSNAYIAGVWKDSIVSDVAWYHKLRGPAKPKLAIENIPSWSWVSIRAPVSWIDIKRILPQVQVIDVSYNHVGPINIGQVRNASVSLKGPVLRVVRAKTSRGSFALASDHPAKFVAVIKEREFIDYSLDTADSTVETGEEMEVILMYAEYHAYTGLLLRKVSATEYERYGLLSVQHERYHYPDEGKDRYERLVLDYIASLPLKTVKII